MKPFSKENPNTSFGAFKPVGHLVAVFDSKTEAQTAKTDIIELGIDSDDVTFLDSSDFTEMVDDLRMNQSPLAMLGSELRRVDEFVKEAEKGRVFLIVMTPSRQRTQRTVKILEENGYRFAIKYGHLFFERYDAEH